ncbi:MAG: hypothetical protein R3E12_08315 [Candidatus Eisenbacteria bacterium]
MRGTPEPNSGTALWTARLIDEGRYRIGVGGTRHALLDAAANDPVTEAAQA